MACYCFSWFVIAIVFNIFIEKGCLPGGPKKLTIFGGIFGIIIPTDNIFFYEKE